MKDIIVLFFLLVFVVFLVVFSFKTGFGLAEWLYRLIFRA